jgi:hypothetical protein
VPSVDRWVLARAAPVGHATGSLRHTRRRRDATTAGGAADARAWVYRAAAGLLVALGTLTGARTAVVWFKICPVVLGGGAGLLLAASWL